MSTNPPGYMHKYMQEYIKTDKYRAVKRGTARRWASRNPEKIKAYMAVRQAIIAGRLVKPEACDRCATIVKLHAHHEDYSKPLDVNWFCDGCHKTRHKEMNDVV